MKINKISGLVLFILSVLTVVIHYSSVLIGSQLATGIFALDGLFFLIIGFIWFVSLFFIKKEEGHKGKIFFKLIGKLFLVAFAWILIYLFIGEPATVYGESSSSDSQIRPFSMTTTVGNGLDLVGITLNKTYFISKLSSVNRGSIVDYIFSGENGYESDQFGRVIGLPKENIIYNIKQGTVEINGDLYTEKYADWSKLYKAEIVNYQLKDNEYLVTFDLSRTLKSVDLVKTLKSVSVISKQSIKGVIK